MRSRGQHRALGVDLGLLVLSICVLFGCHAGSPAPPGPGWVEVPATTFEMGSDDGPVDESPVHEVELAAFWMLRQEVSVAEFAEFAAATGHRSDAERLGWSGVFEPGSGRWARVEGASWRFPDGPGRPAEPNEPVTQVSWHDAHAYCRWRGGRLPSEAEMERVARAANGDRGEDGRWRLNVWQGRFPEHDSGEDGFRGRAPVASFPPDALGLFDVRGNVWEWCADWYDRNYYEKSPRRQPRGPKRDPDRNPNRDSNRDHERVIRGGSWLCDVEVCHGYRPSARSHATADTGLNNLGFRCAKD